jgi:RHS repeat-associated protein
MTEVSSKDVTATYSYGISGMREKKEVDRNGIKTTRTSLWIDGKLIAEREGSKSYRYTYGPNGTPLLLWVNSPETGTKDYAFLVDHGGSVIGVVDSAGESVATYSYDPWGRLLSATGSLAAELPLRYRGYYYDNETKMYYLPARYYDPSACRFLSPDPARPSAGNPLSLNRFSYCENDPVNASDPTGAILTDLYLTTDANSIPEQARQEASHLVSAKRHRDAHRDDQAMAEERMAVEHWVKRVGTIVSSGVPYHTTSWVTVGFVTFGEVENYVWRDLQKTTTSKLGFAGATFVIGSPLSAGIAGGRGHVGPGLGDSVGLGVIFGAHSWNSSYPENNPLAKASRYEEGGVSGTGLSYGWTYSWIER